MTDTPRNQLPFIERARRAAVRGRFRLLQYMTSISLQLAARRRRHAGKLEAALWLGIIVIGFSVSGLLQSWLIGSLDEAGCQALRSFVGTVGGAMIGATAIAASFILFALQVNVERLPLGLFRYFSLDKPLITSVAASILLAIGGTALSLVSDPNYLATIVLTGVLALALLLRLLFYAYRRSLRLIDPTEQLKLVYTRLARDLHLWDKRVNALSALVDLDDADVTALRDSRFDTRRAAILHGNPGWDDRVKVAVAQAAAYARRAGESGDLEVSGFALSILLKINETYIAIKGRTFFANQLFIDNPYVTEGVFNETLESLKRLHAAALARRDELQLEQILGASASLVCVLCRIEYGSLGDSKSHALLAAGYLERAVEAIVPSGLTDTVMRGLQAMGRGATAFIATSAATEAVGLFKKIAIIGMAGAIKPDDRPVTLVAMEELSDLTLNLIRSEEHDPGFAVRQLHESVASLCHVFLQFPDAIIGGHSTYVGPYYSVTNINSLAGKLANMANALAERAADDVVAARVADHIAIWADQLFLSQKDLLLLAIEKRSNFFLDISRWIAQVTEVLLVVAAAPATRDHARDELRTHAHSLVNTLSWIPKDEETAKFVEGRSHRDNLVGLALRCRRHDEMNIYETVQRMMLDWALKAGAHHTGWDTLAQWLLALAGLAVTAADETEPARLRARLTAALAESGSPNQEIRDAAGRSLREAAHDIYQREFEINRVRHLLSRGDGDATRQLVIDLANILSPETKDEPVQLVF